MRLSVVEFGKHLFQTNDLDPVYVTLHSLLNEGVWNINQVSRWLVAYWCLYHCGAACYLSEREGEEFWSLLMAAARNEEKPPAGERWPRGHERRHFRGQQGIKAVSALHQRYTRPELMLEYVIGEGENRQFKEVSERVQDHRGFGPWIGFKVCDMIDRVLGIPVSFEEAEVFMFTDPTEAAIRVWRIQTGYPDTARPKDVKATIHEVVNYLRNEFKEFKAPPRYERPVDLPEVETVLCKYKSFLNGHYPLFCDIDDITKGLGIWTPACVTAGQFSERMPKHEV